MCEANRSTIEFPALSSQDVLTDILRVGAQTLLTRETRTQHSSRLTRCCIIHLTSLVVLMPTLQSEIRKTPM